ncbi:MAG: TnpV protein, partial [Ruminococcus sp.]|nr:TnpV protein [Ruminococcus sp.]
MVKRLGTGTLLFENMPRVEGFASVVGKKESEGPLGALFDKTEYDSRGGCETFEEAESRLQQEAARLCMEKADLRAQELDAVFAGDLLNQCTGSSFGLMHYGAPYLGQYGACSTMAQALLMAAVFTESGAADHALCVTSSHFCAAERQYRFPMEYGAVRTPTAQWTVTGAGSCILGKSRGKVAVRAAAVGKIQDMGVTDANNMGAAMAPAICIIRPYPSAQKRRLHLCFHDYITKKEVFVTNCGGDHKVDFSGKSYLNRRRRMSKKISAKNKRYYIQKDDYELPELTLPALEAIYGVWGTRYRHYLMRHDKVKYYTLLCSCVLHEHITEIDLRADRFYEETVNRL